MKITTHIDGALLERVLRVSHARTKREVLENGLRALWADIQRNTFVREFDHLRLRLTPRELDTSRR